MLISCDPLSVRKGGGKLTREDHAGSVAPVGRTLDEGDGTAGDDWKGETRVSMLDLRETVREGEKVD